MESISLQINGKDFVLPLEFSSLSISATFEGLSNTASVSFERLTLVNEAAFEVLDTVKQYGSYLSIPAKLSMQQDVDDYVIFDGYIDPSKGIDKLDPSFLSDLYPVQIQCSFVESNTRDELRDKIEGKLFTTLKNKGVFNQSDYENLPFVIEEDFEPLKFFISVYVAFSLFDKINEAAKETAEAIQDVIAIATGGGVGLGQIAAVIYAIALALIKLAYNLLLVALLLNMLYTLFNTILPIPYNHKVQSLYSLLEKACNYFGYNFVCPIEAAKLDYYLASTPFDDSTNLVKELLPFPALIKEGLPNMSDYGNVIGDMFQLAKDLYGAKLSLYNGEVHLRNYDDPFWLQESTVILPDVAPEVVRDKVEALKGTKTFEFTVDYSDTWTVRNYTGTSYQIDTEVKNESPDRQSKIKGLERKILPVGLVNRKDSLNIVEKSLKNVAKAGDALLKVSGGKPTFEKLVKGRVGHAKFSTSTISVPRIVRLEGGRIPADHRDKVGAKAFVTKYRSYESLVQNNFDNQREVLRDMKNMKMSLQTFKKILNNKIAKLYDGRECEIVDFNYFFPHAYADINVEAKKVFDTNLKETGIEP